MPDRAKRLHGQQGPVAGHQEVGLAVDGGLEELVILRIPAGLDPLDDHDVRRELRQGAQEPLAKGARDVPVELRAP